MPFHESKFKSTTNEWATPDSVFVPLNDEFGFTLDVCATAENAKCERFFTKEDNGLNQSWSGNVCWMNPPYGQQIAKWVRKCHEEWKRGATVVALLPARTNTGYWHDYAMAGEIRFIRGYPKFGDAKQGLKAPLAIVIWRATESA